MIRHSTTSKGAAAAAIALFTMLTATAVRAEEAAEEAAGEAAGDSTERARELFREGVGLADGEQWADAAARFEEALALRDAPAIRFNLAAALAQLDRVAEAADHLEAVLASEETNDELRGTAQELLDEVTPRTAAVTVTADGFEGGTTFALDGGELTSDQLGTAIRVDPGSHAATAEVAGEEVARAEAEVAAGETSDLRLEAPRTAVEDSIVDAADGDDGEPVPLIEDWRLWLGVGIGTAVIVTAVALGVALGTSPAIEDPIQGNMDPGVLVWR